ncbi:septal ring lytic transglycosylase RlpA family protein [Sessilibacter sp. MAH4]
MFFQGNTVFCGKSFFISFKLIVLTLVLFIGGCAFKSYDNTSQQTPVPQESNNEGRYSQQHDSAPDQSYAVDHIPDAVPIPEEITRAGNKSPYRVAGRTYHVLSSAQNYRERGFASWYGKKFHGHNTANGEVYNMFGMTAAHKTLPIPSYVQVTNLENGRKVIVRINDRGPFHSGRIIDLSYTAAKKLGFLNAGTANVEVVAIDPIAWQKENLIYGEGTGIISPAPRVSNEPPAPLASEGSALPENTYLQVGAFSSQQAAELHRKNIAVITGSPVIINTPDPQTRLYRVRIGPIVDNLQLAKLRNLLTQSNVTGHHLVYE